MKKEEELEAQREAHPEIHDPLIEDMERIKELEHRLDPPKPKR
jgi:hypothetical protein